MGTTANAFAYMRWVSRPHSLHSEQETALSPALAPKVGHQLLVLVLLLLIVLLLLLIVLLLLLLLLLRSFLSLLSVLLYSHVR